MKFFLVLFSVLFGIFVLTLTTVNAQGVDPSTLPLPCPAHDNANEASRDKAKVNFDGLCIVVP